MTLQKAAEELELSQLHQRVRELEAQLAEGRVQLETLQGDVKTQQRTIDELMSDKSQLERDVHHCRSGLETALNEKTAREQEVTRLKRVIDQSDVLQQEEIVRVQRRAELAEEEAQSYKRLLEDSENRRKDLQMDMESERISARRTSEDLQEQNLNLTKSISVLQEEIRSLQSAKSSLEQSVLFHNTEAEGLKEQLRISQGQLHRKSSVDQDNVHHICSLEEEVASKQAAIDELKCQCTELTRVTAAAEKEIGGLRIHTEALEKQKSSSEQKVKSLKSEILRWKQQLETAKEETTLMKKSEQALQLRCKNLQVDIQKRDSAASTLQKRVSELKEMNVEMDRKLKDVRGKHEQAVMERDRKNQQIQIFKSQVEGVKSQVRIVEEELRTKAQLVHEQQMKLQEASELEQTNRRLSAGVKSYMKEIKTLKSDLMSALAERKLAKQKVDVQNAEVNELKVKHVREVKALEEELSKCKRSAGGSTERILRQEVLEFSSSLKRVKEELAKEIRHRQIKGHSDTQLQGAQQETGALKTENAEALEKNISPGSESNNKQQTPTKAEEKQREHCGFELTSQQIKEQLESCKRMLEQLKVKLEPSVGGC